jgi:putative acetyltransferase
VNTKTTELIAEDAFLRRARIDELPDIAKIHRLAFSRALPHLRVRHSPADDLNFYSTAIFPHSELRVLEWSGMIVGFIAFRSGWVEQLYIHPDCQGRGLGSRLVTVAQESSDTLRVWTFQANVGARAFYESHGFQVERETDGSGNEEREPDVLYCWQRGVVGEGRPGVGDAG